MIFHVQVFLVSFSAKTCVSSDFTCVTKHTCVDRGFVYDGDDDCDDGSDE